MELLGRNTKRSNLAAGEPPPRTTGAVEASSAGPTTHSNEPPPPPDAGGGGSDDDGVDRISGLPDAVLGEILSLLSTKEAGRTQILASRWRHVWLASPLVLDGADLYSKTKKAQLGDRDADEMQLTAATIAAYQDLAYTVTQILSAHPGPVRRLCIPSLYLYNRRTSVDAWLSSPVLDNLQELEFCERYDPVWWCIEPSQLAPSPASSFRLSGTLRVASFCRCNIPDSSVEGIHFPHLQQLGLERVSISVGSLHTMISCCPVLECLLFKNNIGVGCLQISSNSLRSIAVGANRYFGEPQLHKVIIVDAPCLERFLFKESGSNSIDLTVISAPKLETLGFLKDGKQYDYHPRIVIGATVIQGINVVSLTTVLFSVKILAIASRPHINLDTVIELLKCFPCLQKLYIESPISGEKNRWRRKHRDFIKSFDIHLKTIVLEEYRGIRAQVNFASFFLLNARELESLKLGVRFTDYNEAFFTEQHGKLQMEKRASRGARLDFTKKTCTRLHVNHVHDLIIADPFECRC